LGKSLKAVKVVIAGAAGFIGKLLLEDLSPDHEVIALGRSVPAAGAGTPSSSVEWRNCDLFSLLQAENAVKGAEVAIYLVHSMLPRASLTQSTFEDCDLLLADNFARAARRAGVKRIIYLGGLVPSDGVLSKHLLSRKEVETALSGGGIAVTCLRSGLVLGAQGSSFQMLYTLVKRLPVMICPKWTATLTQCTAASDVVSLIRFCIHDPRTVGETFDVGGPEVLTYRNLMALLAEEMHVRRRFFSVPFFSPGLSRLWVQLITGGSRNLVSPLVQSLKHEMIVRDDRLMRIYGKPLLGVREALRRCLTGIAPTLRSSTKQRWVQLRGRPEVRSIQRMPLPPGKTAAWVAQQYFEWLPRFLYPFVLVNKVERDTWALRVLFLRTPLLLLWFCSERSTQDRQLFYIRGGLLARAEQGTNARLEFREVLQGQACLAAIHEFRPRLRWEIYKYTQALAHLWVMRRFRKHLRAGMES
jgi:uncharacterized protein YbjT (DUF2867 family)